MPGRSTVLYIAGAGRSGSTLLANILGEVEGCFAAGEVRYLWERGLLEQRLCGCGEPVAECPVWSAVLERAYGAAGTDPAEVRRLQARTSRLRHLPFILTPFGRRGAFDRDVAAYARLLAPLYEAMHEVTGASVIVDSSKLPAYGAVLDRVDGIDLAVAHLVRDARASAYSWLRRKPLADRAERTHMQRQGPLQSSALWTIWNAVAQRLWSRSDRYVLVRYEDLLADPPRWVARVLGLVGLEGSALPFTAPASVKLGVNHSVAGNPDRLRHGDVRLKADTEWLAQMRPADRRKVTAVAAPLLLRYGYGLRRPRERAGTAPGPEGP